ncbi:MAG: hypothetical protein K0B02_05410 [DPANN group archaeon]|nr:hypothetical protein [DPANN group archaeon]
MVHTKTFFDAVCYIAELEKVDAEHISLLKIATLYHDRGYLVSAKDNKDENVKIACFELHAFGLNQSEIDCIYWLILSTKIPTYPKNEFEMIMCDSDLEVLGRDYFPYVSEFSLCI